MIIALGDWSEEGNAPQGEDEGGMGKGKGSRSCWSKGRSVGERCKGQSWANCKIVVEERGEVRSIGYREHTHLHKYR